jgi:peptidoglycan/LPS O-acetylase OafA/YrhL
MRKNKQIVGLDALRFLAALLVVAFHLCFLHGGLFIAPYQALMPFTYFGWIGVEIFFVLSGFVIAYSAQGVTAGQFLRHRIVRLFPGALICATLTAVILRYGESSSPRDLLLAWSRSVLFSPKGPWIDNSYWTLSIEVAFYAVIFLLLLCKKMNALQAVISCLGLLSTAFWIISSLPGSRLGAYLSDSIVANGPRNILLVRHGCYFAIGVLLWISLFKRFTTPRLLVLILCSIGGVLQIIYRSSIVAGYSHYEFSPVIPVLVWILALGAIVISVTGNEKLTYAIGPGGVTAMRRLGLMTYPLYLLHAEIGLKLTTMLRSYVSPRLALVAAIASVILMSYLISVYVEPPLQRKIKQLLSMSSSRNHLVRS